ncbi:MAG TPA: MATE family efflux transporter, partial [Dielma fastidiosa]|nr:MATE family efflux transporter [Dielma fastidiosa]
EVMNTPANILEDALTYIIIIFWGIGATIAFNLFSAMLRALGDSRTPLYAMIVSSLVNIGLDLYFVISLGMGVAGAAYATVIAQILSCFFCFFRILGIKDLHLKKQHWSFHPELLLRLFKLGVPVAFMNSVTAIGVMVLQFVVNGFGSIYVAAYSTANKIMNLVEQPGVTFGLAMATYAGQNLGAGQYERIKLGLNKTIQISTGVNIVLALIMLLFGKQILALMVSGSEVEVIQIAYQYIIICVLALWVLGLLFIYRSSLQGMGDTVIPMVSGAVEFITRIVIAVTLPGIIAFHSIGVAEISAWITAT